MVVVGGVGDAAVGGIGDAVVGWVDIAAVGRVVVETGVTWARGVKTTVLGKNSLHKQTKCLANCQTQIVLTNPVFSIQIQIWI